MPCSRRRRRRCCTIAADPKHLGAKIGVTMVLHTWGSALTHHPHVHCVVPGGGISPDGQRWISCRPGYFLCVKVLSRLFRRLMCQRLAAAHAKGALQFFGENAALKDERMRSGSSSNPLRRWNWFVYAKRPFAGPDSGALLSRPLHPSRRHRQFPPCLLRWRPCPLQMERLPARRTGPLRRHDARCPRVHPPFPAARLARRLSSHPPLWPVRQSHPRRHHRQSTRTSRRRAASIAGTRQSTG